MILFLGIRRKHNTMNLFSLAVFNFRFETNSYLCKTISYTEF